MVRCRKCGHNYDRSYCDYCSRAEKWKRQAERKKILFFTPRIQRDLLDIDIKVNEEDVFHVRKGGGLMIYGSSTGCGKTLYAAKVMLESMRLCFIERTFPREHVFISVPELLQKIRDTYDTGEEMIFHKYEFLVLDDLGIEKVNEWVLEKLYQIINYRYEHLLPTVFTSNLSGGELSDRLDDRISSRLEQMCRIKKLKEIDYRQKAKR